MDKDSIPIQLDPQSFPEHTAPYGFLAREPACQALWRYYLTMMRNLEEMKKPRYEGEPDFVLNWRQLSLGISNMYGLGEPGAMRAYWSNVDLQCTTLGFMKLPEEYRRF